MVASFDLQVSFLNQYSMLNLRNFTLSYQYYYNIGQLDLLQNKLAHFDLEFFLNCLLFPYIYLYFGVLLIGFARCLYILLVIFKTTFQFYW